MRSRRAAFSLLAALAIAATIGLKAATLNVATAPDLLRFNRELAAHLATQGFATAIEDRMLEMDLVVATRGACRLKARAEDNADRYLSFRHFTADLPVVRYRYRGDLLTAFPRGRHDLHALADRIGARLRLIETTEQPLAIAASAACDLSAIDFGPQRIYLRPL